MSEQYSNREIDSHFSEIKEQLTRIEAQTLKTNGRVTKLENWQSLLIGGATIVSIVVIPIITWVFSDVLRQQKESLNTHITADSEKWDMVYKKLNLK